MKKLKVMSIFGSRPEANKMVPLIQEMESDNRIESIVCVTAQHREQLDQSLKPFGIVPKYDLDIMKKNQSLTDIVTRALVGLGNAIENEKPDICLVHGDTATTFVGALACFYSKTMVGHVEAGLRSFNKYEPYPEEINRRLTTVLADINFAPTMTAKENLLKENIDEKTIYITGNTAIDCIKNTVKDSYVFVSDILNGLDYKNKRMITLTAHRKENLGEPLENICKAVLRIVTDNNDVEVVYPVHLNPLVREVAFRVLGNHPRIHLIEPIEMLDMHNLMKLSYMIMTDSGGLQEEAPFLRKPVLVLRNVTERPEGVHAGILKLAGITENEIYDNAKELLTNKSTYNKMAESRNPFGDGNASKRIIEAMLYHFNYINQRPKDYI